MTHATSEEIHDHAYGFRLSEHVAGCAECGRAVDAVAAEREALRDVLDEDPAEAPAELLQRLAAAEPQRRRIGSAALAAAALLLAALAWALLQPRSAVDSAGPAAAAPTQEAEIERLIGELKKSKARAEIARGALRAYGGSAVEPLIKARADRALIDECRGLSIADQTVIGKLKEKSISLDWNDAPLMNAVDQLREASGASFHVVGVDNVDSLTVSLKLQGSSVYECLERLSAVTKIPFSVSNGIVQLGRPQPPPESWAPLRFPPRLKAATDLAADLKREASREEAFEGLRKLAFSAEPVLWDLLDAADVAPQASATQLLRILYSREGAPGLRTPLRPDQAAAVKILETWKEDIEVINGRPLDLLADLTKRSGLSILIDPESDLGDRQMTFKSKDLILKNVLKLFLSQFTLDYVAGDGWVLVTKPGRAMLSNHGPVWLPVDEARAVQAMLIDAVSPEAAPREAARQKLLKTGRPALPWLDDAADASPSVEAALYRALQREIADSLSVWMVDRPTGVDLQTLTHAQKAILARPMAAGQKGLENLPIVVKSPGEVRLFCSTAPGLRLGSFLKAVTRVQGLDLYMAGDDIVIDTAANVRKIVEK